MGKPIHLSIRSVRPAARTGDFQSPNEGSIPSRITRDVYVRKLLPSHVDIPLITLSEIDKVPAMKVRELIEKLQALPNTVQEFPVYYMDSEDGHIPVDEVVVQSLPEILRDGSVAVILY